jgi:16S rRNA (guanine966-N2)-methyltransferase
MQTIRIIGGKYRGKKLTFPERPGLRPTKDFVKETLFNWLMHKIRGATCLDAFAGSGALGFEAFSRGAASVILLEQDQYAYASLEKHVASFNAPTAINSIKTNTLDFLQKTTMQFDIVFLDPPFAENLIQSCLNTLAIRALISPGGLVYIESPTDINFDEDFWQVLKVKKAGQVIYGLFKIR